MGEVAVDAADGVVRMRLFGSPSAGRLRASFVTLRELLARHSPRLLLIGHLLPALAVVAALAGMPGRAVLVLAADHRRDA